MMLQPSNVTGNQSQSDMCNTMRIIFLVYYVSPLTNRSSLNKYCMEEHALVKNSYMKEKSGGKHGTFSLDLPQ